MGTLKIDRVDKHLIQGREAVLIDVLWHPETEVKHVTNELPVLQDTLPKI